MSIMTNSTLINLRGQNIGQIAVDGTEVRGEGGPINPQLVVPLEVQLDNQPEEAPLALGRLRATLGTDKNFPAATAICPPVCVDLVGGFRVRSGSTSSTSRGGAQVELRFFLTLAQAEELERHRHANSGDIFYFYLRLEPTIIGLKNFNVPISGQLTQPTIWDAKYGMYAEPVVFWAAPQPPALRVDVETSSWVRRVLPGLGYDRARLIEVRLPPALPDQPNAAAEFDRAKVALDGRRYEDSVAACRGLLTMWKEFFGADREPIANVIARQQGWSQDDGRRQFLDALWKATTDFVNAPHHPEGSGQGIWLDHRDARLTLMVTTLLSEYLGSLPPS
jgi:hypothetical protein